MKKPISNSIALIAIFTILLLLIIPVESDWCFADQTFALIVSLVVFLSISFVIIFKHQYRVQLIDIFIFMWYIYICIYSYIKPTYPTSSFVLKATLFLCLFFSLRFILNKYRHKDDVIATTIILICFVEALIGLYQIASGYSRNNTQMVTGTFYNSGPWGIMLSCGIVQLISFLRKYSETIMRNNLLKLLSYIIGGTMLLMLFSTINRTAILSLLIFLLYIFRDIFKRHFFLTLICLIFIIVFLYHVKVESALGRTIIWWVSWHSITQNIIVGTGIGSFLHQYAETLAKLSCNAVDGSFNNTNIVHYAFNTFLHIGVEQGLTGMIVACIIIFITIKKIREVHSLNSCVLMVIFVSSLFSYTLEMLPFQIITVVILASLFSRDIESGYIGKPMSPIPLLGLFMVLSVISLSHVMRRVEANDKYNFFKGTYTKDYIQDYYSIYPYMQDNPNFLFDFAKVLSNSRRYNDSNAVLQKGQSISADPMFIILQGNNFESMGETELAMEYYQKGFRVMPNRLYPLHKMMLLYAKTGQQKKARIISKRILSFPVKIESNATKEMKKDALEVWNSIY